MLDCGSFGLRPLTRSRGLFELSAYTVNEDKRSHPYSQFGLLQMKNQLHTPQRGRGDWVGSGNFQARAEGAPWLRLLAQFAVPILQASRGQRQRRVRWNRRMGNPR